MQKTSLQIGGCTEVRQTSLTELHAPDTSDAACRCARADQRGIDAPTRTGRNPWRPGAVGSADRRPGGCVGPWRTVSPWERPYQTCGGPPQTVVANQREGWAANPSPMLAGRSAHRSPAVTPWGRLGKAERLDETDQLAIVFQLVEEPVELVQRRAFRARLPPRSASVGHTSEQSRSGTQI
jgi:hypothetical protein